MTALYELKTAGSPPVALADMKAYMKVTATADDALITSMIEAATAWGEKYTGREFRANTWTLRIDAFADRICLNRNPVDSISSVKHLVSGSLDTVSSDVYYKKDNTQFSEILLNEDEEWPTDTDNREQAIEIEFVTKAYRCIDQIETAIKRHVAFWYANRGDCGNDGACDCQGAAVGSGVTVSYDQFRISRV